MSANKINPSNFGYPPQHYVIDATQVVLELEGERRNLPQYQFDILHQTGHRRPNGSDGFFTFRNGIDGVNTDPNAQG